MSIYTHAIATLDGEPLDLEGLRGKAVLVVNVASKCGLTPQYTGLEELQHKYSDRGFTVLGVPCNQFGAQEPGTAEEISTFCSSTYGVTFPITEKVDVNGQRKHSLFAELELKADSNGDAGDIQWNFEKFLIAPDGEIIGRFRPGTDPEDPELVAAIEASLPDATG
jgi:glutathione peroxidase